MNQLTRHAYLIIASGYHQELKKLISMLDFEDNDIFFFFFLKDRYFCAEEYNDSCKYSNLFFVNRIRVSWGGYSQIECTLELLEAARSNGDYAYYHLLSCTDFPVKSQSEIHKFFSDNYGINLITPPKYNHDPAKIRMRYEQFHFLQDSLVGKERNVFKYIDFALCYFQKCIGIRRFSHKQMALSSNWFSITQPLVDFILDNSQYIREHYRYTYCCDEIFLISEILDTEFMNTISLYGNMRYVQWKRFTKHDTSPRALNMSDYEAIRGGHYLFARKAIFPESKKLVDTFIQSFQAIDRN